MDDLDPDLNYDFFTHSGHRNCLSTSLSQYLELSSSLKDLSIINFNIRSFHANFDRFSAWFSYVEMPSILVLTETWFSLDQTVEIPGYSGHHIVRNGRSGGVSVFVKNHIESFFLPEFSYVSETIEVCSVEIKIQNV